MSADEDLVRLALAAADSLEDRGVTASAGVLRVLARFPVMGKPQVRCGGR